MENKSVLSFSQIQNQILLYHLTTKADAPKENLALFPTFANTVQVNMADCCANKGKF